MAPSDRSSHKTIRKEQHLIWPMTNLILLRTEIIISHRGDMNLEKLSTGKKKSFEQSTCRKRDIKNKLAYNKKISGSIVKLNQITCQRDLCVKTQQLKSRVIAKLSQMTCKTTLRVNDQ